MSTRASVIIKCGKIENKDILYFYQHCDGYPSGLGETLKEFCKSRIAERCKGDRDYLGGALILFVNNEVGEDKRRLLPDLVPTKCVHGDEAYQYIIDSDSLELSINKNVIDL